MDIEVLKVVHQLEIELQKVQMELECSNIKLAQSKDIVRQLGFQIRNLESALGQRWWNLGRLFQLPDAARGVVDLARQKGILSQGKK